MPLSTGRAGCSLARHVFGLVGAATQAGVALGPGLMGLLHDALGRYQTARWCLMALEGVAVASVLGGRALRDDAPTL